MNFSQLRNVYKLPCAREAFLYGIGCAFALGGLQLVLTRSLRKCTNWSVGSFVGVSVAIWEGCRYKRLNERRNVKRVVEIMSKRSNSSSNNINK